MTTPRYSATLVERPFLTGKPLRKLLPRTQRIRRVFKTLKELVNYVSAARPFPFQALLEAVTTRYDTIETAGHLYAQVKEKNIDELFSGSHYSAKANEIVAGVIAEAIIQRYQAM